MPSESKSPACTVYSKSRWRVPEPDAYTARRATLPMFSTTEGVPVPVTDTASPKSSRTRIVSPSA